MRIYETTFIVNPQSDDSTIESKVKAVTDLIASNGGKVIHENRIGTRRLAYAIKRLTQGYYTSLIFEAEPVILPTLERMYKLDEAFIRYLTVIYEGNVKELIEPKEEETSVAESDKKEVKSEDSGHRRGRREEAVTKKEAEVTEEKKETEEKPVEEAPAPVEEKEEKPEAVESSETEESTKLTSPEDDEL